MTESQFSIVIIKPNKLDLNILSYKKKANYPDLDINNSNDSFKLKHNFVDIEKFKEDTKDYIFIDSNINDLNISEKIIEYLKLTPEQAATTKDCYEKNNNLFQLCHIDPADNTNMESRGNNYLASLLTLNNILIDGTAIFINIYLDTYNNMKNVDSTIEDLLSILISKKIHYGVYLGYDGSIDQICFNNNKEVINLDTYLSKNTSIEQCLLDNNYKELEICLYKFNLNIFIQNIDSMEEDNIDNTKINYNITKLLRMQTYGNIIITSRTTESIFGDLTYSDVTNMLKISHTNWDLTKNELEDEKDNMGRYIIKNKYKILNNRVTNL